MRIDSDQVALDYGGSFVVNLWRHHVSPSQFGRDESGLKSVLFQKPVCFLHANGGGFAAPRRTSLSLKASGLGVGSHLQCAAV